MMRWFNFSAGNDCKQKWWWFFAEQARERTFFRERRECLFSTNELDLEFALTRANFRSETNANFRHSLNINNVQRPSSRDKPAEQRSCTHQSPLSLRLVARQRYEPKRNTSKHATFFDSISRATLESDENENTHTRVLASIRVRNSKPIRLGETRDAKTTRV